MNGRWVDPDTLAAALLSSGLMTSNVPRTRWGDASQMQRDLIMEWAAAILAAIPPDPRLAALLAAARKRRIVTARHPAEGGFSVIHDAALHGIEEPCDYCDALAAFEEKVSEEWSQMAADNVTP